MNADEVNDTPSDVHSEGFSELTAAILDSADAKSDALTKAQTDGRKLVYLFIVANSMFFTLCKLRDGRKDVEARASDALNTSRTTSRTSVRNDLKLCDVIDLLAGNVVPGRISCASYEFSSAYHPPVEFIDNATRAKLLFLASVHKSMGWKDFYVLCKDVRSEFKTRYRASLSKEDGRALISSKLFAVYKAFAAEKTASVAVE